MKAVDAATTTLVTGWKSAFEKYLQQQGRNMTFTSFKPISYKTQVVAGVNYTIVIQVTTTITIEFTVWKKLDGTIQVTKAVDKA